MKISKLFHWLYFAVMMLPIFILPIFGLAVRSDNNFDPIEIQVQENVKLNFNQLVKNGNFEDTSYWDTTRCTISTQNNVVKLTCNQDSWYRISQAYDNFDTSHLYYFNCVVNFSYSVNSNNPCAYGFQSDPVYYLRENGTSHIQTIIQPTSASIAFWCGQTNGVIGQEMYISNFYIIDLTNVFGFGNEPTLAQCQIYFTDDYYDYGEYDLMLPIGNVTYNDTDVGSQMVYIMYQGVNKYFNYDKVFNFSVLYDWLQLTFFNGNATLGFFIFWHLLIYWLLTSLLWLLFDVLMYVPNLVHRWLDKASLD